MTEPLALVLVGSPGGFGLGSIRQTWGDVAVAGCGRTVMLPSLSSTGLPSAVKMLSACSNVA